MRRSGISEAVIAFALGLLLVVLGLGVVPATAGGSATEPQVGTAELVAQVMQDEAVARTSHPIHPGAGGSIAVLPGREWVPTALPQRSERETSGTHSGAADVCMRLMRAPPTIAT